MLNKPQFLKNKLKKKTYDIWNRKCCCRSERCCHSCCPGRRRYTHHHTLHRIHSSGTVVRRLSWAGRTRVWEGRRSWVVQTRSRRVWEGRCRKLDCRRCWICWGCSRSPDSVGLRAGVIEDCLVFWDTFLFNSSILLGNMRLGLHHERVNKITEQSRDVTVIINMSDVK